MVLRGEVKRLEGKMQNLSSALEEQKKVNVEVSDQVMQGAGFEPAYIQDYLII